ncbi:aggregation-promoting factor [Lactiplantibacillus daowaiensis]|uniref:LysM peptidoglycan-binding domain-containing protein n=1 Tax=Lactiplantibacillus daowaiensis TaxID=2559918 RepID=A0ABW1S448_9LACO|nr:LysM peptidoglycan-binding domain-containing protein [Lactiplantibacillus daowaiensis]
MKIKNFVLSTIATFGLFAVATTTANAATVTVKSGDTVAKIANAHNTTVAAIKKANSLSNVNMIYVGDKLEVGGTSTTTTSTSTASTASATTTSTATTSTTSTTTSSSDSAAKAWIANKESGGSYTASNGNYYGKYQLTKSLLNGDLSAANQEKVANAYVASRYGSWTKAKAFWMANGWY